MVMNKPDAQDRYKARTGRSWLEAVTESGRLQQEAVDAHARYTEAFAEVPLEEEQKLQEVMRQKFEVSAAYWDQMWADLKDS
jgi:hypothetical protein